MIRQPKEGETWALKSDPTKTLRIRFVNCCDIVGFSEAHHMKRSYGTRALTAFLRRYKPA